MPPDTMRSRPSLLITPWSLPHFHILFEIVKLFVPLAFGICEFPTMVQDTQTRSSRLRCFSLVSDEGEETLGVEAEETLCSPKACHWYSMGALYVQ